MLRCVLFFIYLYEICWVFWIWISVGDRLAPSDCCPLAFMSLCSLLPHLPGLVHEASRTWQKWLYATSKPGSWLLSPSPIFSLESFSLGKMPYWAVLWAALLIGPCNEEQKLPANSRAAVQLILEGDTPAPSSFQMIPVPADVLIATSCKALC